MILRDHVARGADCTPMDAISLLKDDHRAVEALFKRFEQAGSGAHVERRRIVDDIIKELSVHAEIEETVFYPAVREAVPPTNDEVLEALEEHHVAKWVLSELEGMDPTAERFEAKVTVLIENVRHHVEEEESELFPQVRNAMSRKALDDMGDALQQAKAVAPTRPHPRSPDTPPGNIVSGVVASALDRAREAGQELVEGVGGVARRATATASSPSASTRRTARKSTAKKTTAKKAATSSAKRAAGSTAKKARASAKKATGSAKKATRSTKTTARKAAGTTKRTTKKATGAARSTARKATGTTKRTTKKAAGTTKRTTARKATGTTRKTARKATGTTKKGASRSTARKAAGTTTRTTKRATGASRSTARKATGTTKRTTKKSTGAAKGVARKTTSRPRKAAKKRS
jgi:hemerythrin superfamily protein